MARGVLLLTAKAAAAFADGRCCSCCCHAPLLVRPPTDASSLSAVCLMWSSWRFSSSMYDSWPFVLALLFLLWSLSFLVSVFFGTGQQTLTFAFCCQCWCWYYFCCSCSTRCHVLFMVFLLGQRIPLGATTSCTRHFPLPALAGFIVVA